MEVEAKTNSFKVLKAIRDDIVKGVYAPGERLPTRSEFATRLNSGMATVQYALSTLARQGFVVWGKQRRQGSYVAERPPHLHRNALVFPHPSKMSRFHTAVIEAARQLAGDDATASFREYFSGSDPENHRGSVDLCEDLTGRALAGVIFAYPPEDLLGTKAMDASVPHVVTVDDPTGTLNLPHVAGDQQNFLDRAFEYLFARGRRRIAHLRVDFAPRRVEDDEKDLRQRGVAYRSFWNQSVPEGGLFRAAANIVQLLMRLHGDDRPDGLIVYDDNLVEHVIAGLLAAGVRVPDDLEVVAQANYPSAVPGVIPIRRLGFDCRTILRESLRVLRVQKDGGTPPDMTRVPAIFENELAGGNGVR